MSLKAKIEAVIYASEEPVTLAQLEGLLGHEAQRELDHIAARQHPLAFATERDDLAAIGDEPIPAEAEVEAETTVESKQEQPAPAPDPLSADSAAETPESAADRRAAREKDRKLRDYLRGTVDALIADYATADRGLEVREVAGGFRMATKPEYHDAVRGFVRTLKPPLKLTLQALETLAVVAYKQPVTVPEISEIRGVDSGGVLGSLMARKLITTAGRKQVVGRPILYKTTKDFLLRFGLKDVAELPSIEEFEKMAGELADIEPVQKEISMSTSSSSAEQAEERITHEDLEEEKYASAPQADGDSSSLGTDEGDEPGEELPAVDGRLSGLPPNYDQPGDDPSAEEAAIQNSEEA